MEGTLIAVGREYPFFQNGTRNMLCQDGALFEAFEDNVGFVLAIYLNHPNIEEIMDIRQEPISTRLIQEDNLVLPMVKFGKKRRIFEMSFDPTLYEDARAFQWKENNNVLTIVLIDSSNGNVAALRQANFPLKMIQRCTEAWAKAFLEPNYSKTYANWYLKLQQKTVEQLWDRAVYVGKMGETYNLDEIHYRPDSHFYNTDKN